MRTIQIILLIVLLALSLVFYTKLLQNKITDQLFIGYTIVLIGCSSLFLLSVKRNWLK